MSERFRMLYSYEGPDDLYCADCGCRLHEFMERVETIDGDICEECFEVIIDA